MGAAIIRTILWHFEEILNVTFSGPLPQPGSHSLLFHLRSKKPRGIGESVSWAALLSLQGHCRQIEKTTDSSSEGKWIVLKKVMKTLRFHHFLRQERVWTNCKICWEGYLKQCSTDKKTRNQNDEISLPQLQNTCALLVAFLNEMFRWFYKKTV